jgi:hypothetical protein
MGTKDIKDDERNTFVSHGGFYITAEVFIPRSFTKQRGILKGKSHQGGKKEEG